MAGVLFIINVPQMEYEVGLRNKINKEKANAFPEHKKITEYYVEDGKPMSEFKSTDCLHRERDIKQQRKKSEIFITVGETVGENKNYLKTSWEEMKDTLKKKKKVKISRPMRGADVLEAFHWDTPLETILTEVISRLDIKNATWCGTRNNKFWQVTFSLESSNLCEELLQVLKTFGIGCRYQSSMSLLPCSLYLQSSRDTPSTDDGDNDKYENMRSSSAWSRFSSSVRARTNLAQVLHDVRVNANLTFDWLFQLVVAAFVAAVGLVENSTVILVASMLISPLMGPITAGTLGTAVKDRSLQRMGLKHEMLGLFMALNIGFFFGLVICTVDGRYGVIDKWPTNEMMSRCAVRSLWVGIMVAIPSGACVALAVLGDYTASLVGVAISASLLPPAVNAGLLWAMSLFRYLSPNEDNTWIVVKPTELAILGSASLCLTLINILCIFLAGVAVYKIKEVGPLDTRDLTWWRANKNQLSSNIHGRYSTTSTSGLSSIHGRYSTTSTPSGWEIESNKWSNTSTDMKQTNEVNQELNGDTVTFRRPHFERMKAQTLEDCLRKPQNTDSYQSLNSADTAVIDSTSEKRGLDLSFYNLRYENQKTEDYLNPTIEPSLTLTIDSKRNCMFLGNKRDNSPSAKCIEKQ